MLPQIIIEKIMRKKIWRELLSSLLCFRFWRDEKCVIKTNKNLIKFHFLLTNAYWKFLWRPWTVLLAISWSLSDKFVAFVAVICDSAAKSVALTCVPAVSRLVWWSATFGHTLDVWSVPGRIEIVSQVDSSTMKCSEFTSSPDHRLRDISHAGNRWWHNQYDNDTGQLSLNRMSLVQAMQNGEHVLWVVAIDSKYFVCTPAQIHSNDHKLDMSSSEVRPHEIRDYKCNWHDFQKSGQTWRQFLELDA